MSEIVAIRIDSRLIHGQTANLWHGYWNCDRYIVIDDQTANDPALKAVMRIAAPAGIKLSVLTEETAVKYLSEPNHYGKERLVIITKWLTPLVKIVDAGIPFNCDVVVGQMVMGEGRDKVVNGHIKVNDDDIKNFHYLADKGIKFYHQVIPQNAPEEFMALLATVEK